MSGFSEKSEGVRFNIISVTRGWVGFEFTGKKSYVTLEWPLTAKISALVRPTLLAAANMLNPRMHSDIVPSD